MEPQGNTERERAYLAHLNSPYWDSLRLDVVARANGICELCGERRLTQVHHLHYDTLGHETLNDVQGLCARCHRYCHGLLPEQLAKKAARKGSHRSNKRRIRHAKRLLANKGVEFGKGFKPNPLGPPPANHDWSFRDRLVLSLNRPLQ